MDVILTVDVGSSSVRCAAYSMKGTNVEAVTTTSSLPLRLVTPNTGKIRLQLSSGTLMDRVDECVDSVLKKIRQQKKPFHIVGVGFSSFVMNLVAVDADGNFIGEDASISYASNTPSVARECQKIREELGPEGLKELYQKTGAPIHSAYALPQLRELYKSSPEVSKRVFKWQSIASLCLCRWTGRTYLPISYSEASWTGLLNFRYCAYEVATTELLPPGCQATLPPLADFSETISGIPQFIQGSQPNKYWSDWPELQNSSLFLGLGDGACANVGSKCSTASRVAVTIGTSAAARVCLHQEVGPSCTLKVPSGLFCYRVDSNHVLLGGALTDGGSVIEWAAQFLNLSSEEAFLVCMNKAEDLARADYEHTSCKNLTMIPFLSGERSTGFRDGATGAVMGITRDTTQAHFLKACLESVCLRLRAILELIVKARDSDTPPWVVVSGKALESNALWRQMVADSSGLKVILDDETLEGTSRGVARLVAISLSTTNENETSDLLCEEDISSFVLSDPRSSACEYFDRAAATQNQFIDSLSPIFM